MSHQNLDYTRRIRELGFRVTPQRQMILDAVCEGQGHTSLEEIYTRLQAKAPTINLATVYRALEFFGKLGLVVNADINGRTVYEIAHETPHHHLVCRQCGRVEGLPHDYLGQLAAQLRQEFGFAPDLDHLTISGLCSQCQRG